MGGSQPAGNQNNAPAQVAPGSRFAQRRQQMGRPQSPPQQPQQYDDPQDINGYPQNQQMPAYDDFGSRQNTYNAQGGPAYEDGIDYSDDGSMQDMVLQNEYGSQVDQNIDLMAPPTSPQQGYPGNRPMPQDFSDQYPNQQSGYSQPQQGGYPQQDAVYGQSNPYDGGMDAGYPQQSPSQMNMPQMSAQQAQPQAQPAPSPFAGIPQVGSQQPFGGNTPAVAGSDGGSNVPDVADPDASPLDETPKAKAARKKKFADLKNSKKKDNRANRNKHHSKLVDSQDGAKKAKMRRAIVYIFMVIIILIGVFRAVVPPKTLGASEVQQIVAAQTGVTGFPTQDGQAIAAQFIQAYIETYGDSAASKMLNTFYTGQASVNSTSGSNANGGMASSSSNISQKIKYGPYVYGMQTRSAKTTDYTVGALIYQTDDRTGQVITEDDGKTPIYKWEFFYVGVYYNEKNNTYGISKDSPSIIPELKTSPQDSIPTSSMPGDGVEQQDAKTTELTNTIHDFMDAWAASKTTTLDVTTTADASYTAKQGLNGLFTIDGDPDYQVFGAPAGQQDGYLRILVTVNLKDTVNSDSFVEYPSKYVLKVKKSGSKYLVNSILPFGYIIPESSNASSN